MRNQEDLILGKIKEGDITYIQAILDDNNDYDHDNISLEDFKTLVNNNQIFPVFAAIENGQPQIAKLLLESGVSSSNESIERQRLDVNITTSPLVLAFNPYTIGYIFDDINDLILLHGPVQIFQALITGNIQRSVVNNLGQLSFVDENNCKGYTGLLGLHKEYITLLDLACYHNQEEVVESIITHKDFDPNNCAVAINLAAFNGNENICKLLLNSKIMFNNNNNINSAFQVACGNNHDKFTACLLDNPKTRNQVNINAPFIDLFVTDLNDRLKNNTISKAYALGDNFAYKIAAVTGSNKTLSLLLAFFNKIYDKQELITELSDCIQKSYLCDDKKQCMLEIIEQAKSTVQNSLLLFNASRNDNSSILFNENNIPSEITNLLIENIIKL